MHPRVARATMRSFAGTVTRWRTRVIAIAINGAAGRMGRTLVQAVQSTAGLALSAAIERPGAPELGQDAGELAGVGRIGVALGDDLRTALRQCAVLIDFTAPVATLAALPACRECGAAVVIGTTGFDDAGRAAIEAAAHDIPIMMTPNMSIGVNVLFGLVDMAARALGDDADVEVTDTHHRQKVDAPSGTALKLGQILATALNRDFAAVATYGRHGQVGARTAREIGFHALRGGDIVGDHTVLFAAMGERIEITHRATSRANFAAGAMRAALWLPGKPAGLYDMQDVLGLR